MPKGDLIQKLVKWTSLGKNEMVRSHVTKNIAPNVKVAMTVIVKQLPKKKDYTRDILHMRADGISFKRIAEILGISYSYVCKLFKDATKDI